jgi:serine/threonine-protein kinase
VLIAVNPSLFPVALLNYYLLNFTYSLDFQNNLQYSGIKLTIEKLNTGEYLQDNRLSVAAILRAYRAGERDFAGENLSALNFQGISLPGINLYGADLTLANWQGSDFSSANLGRICLRRARLKNANLSGAFLAYANLELADLRNANLSGANLKFANLTGANLCGANLLGAQVTERQLAAAKTNWFTILPTGRRKLYHFRF